MNDFLSHLIARTSEENWGVQPRLPARFEPSQQSSQFFKPASLSEEAIDIVVKSPARLSSIVSQESYSSQPPAQSPSHPPHPARQAADSASFITPSTEHRRDFATSQTNPVPEHSSPKPSNSETSQIAQSPLIVLDASDSPTSDSIPAAESLSQTPPIQPLEKRKSLEVASRSIPKQQFSQAEVKAEPLEETLSDERRSHPLLPQTVSLSPTRLDNSKPVESSPPIIRVTIGRIDVRLKPQPETPSSRSQTPPDRLKLEDYLKNRNGKRP